MPFVKQGGFFLALKGKNAKTELATTSCTTEKSFCGFPLTRHEKYGVLSQIAYFSQQVWKRKRKMRKKENGARSAACLRSGARLVLDDEDQHDENADELDGDDNGFQGGQDYHPLS